MTASEYILASASPRRFDLMRAHGLRFRTVSAEVDETLPPDPDAPQPELPPQGEIPSPLDPPSGCAYHTRCPLRFERCDRERPPMYPAPHGGMAACHLLDPDLKQ